MALNETQRQNLKRLDVMDGTGIFSNNTKVNSVDQPTVIISLGGLGGKTLNKLKGEIKRRVNKEGNSIRLLAIDSSNADGASLIEGGDNGPDSHMTREEVFSLYEPSIAVMGIPPFVKKWINPDITPHLTGEGCKGVRQNGRYILAVPAVYQKVRERLESVINSARAAAPGGRVNIIFVAGISGGTGSGTFVDMAYLTRDVMKEQIGLSPSEYKMSAYLYTPDVQFGCGADMNALKSNGYAAMKELDYFYNLDKVGGVYEWPFMEGSIKDSKFNMYDFCTLVSSFSDTGSATEKIKVAMNVMVESLMAIITNAELTNENGEPEQILTSVLDNYENNVQMWRINGLGSDHITYPLSANYKYNVIGYGSARIPVDAIMSYIALKMYENMLDEFHNMSNLTPEYVSRLMASAGVGDVDSLIAAVKDRAQCSYNPAELPSGGDIHGVKNSYRAWRDRAIEHYVTYKNTQSFTNAVNNVSAAIISNFDARLDQAFGEQGPYFVVKTITASFGADGVEGILRRIDGLIDAMNTEYVDRYERCNSADRLIAALDSQAANVPSTLGIVRQDDRDQYLYTAKATIERFTIEMEILTKMQEKLKEIRNYLVDNNNRVFDVYTNVLDYIKNILSKNSDLVVNSSRTTGSNGGEVYSLDVVNLDAAQENGRKLKACLDSFLTPEFLAKFKDTFQDLLRSPENRPAFTDTTDKFNATKLIQKLFDDLLGAFYHEAVERFLIAYYSTSSDMDNINQLDSVMNNDDEKEKALSDAAEAICKKLKDSAKPLCKIIDGSLDGFATPNKYICVPSILYKVFAKHVPTYFGGAKLCKRENAFSIDVVTNHIGIPLAKIHGMNDADISYDHSICENVKGLHMDEAVGSDFKMLPAPFIKEAWTWNGVGNHSCKTELNNIAKVEELVKKLEDYGLIDADIVPATGATENARVKSYFEADITDAMLASLKDRAKFDVNPMTVNADYIGGFLVASGIGTQALPIYINEDAIVSSKENVRTIVRKNIVLFRKLVDFVAKYEKLNNIIEEFKGKGSAEFEFNNNITAFTNLIKTGLITYNNQFRCWNYFDGTYEKPLYNFGMKGPFERAFNLFFAFAEYTTKIDDRFKETLNSLVMEKFNSQQVNFMMPDAISMDIAKLFAPGAPDTAMFLLDRELNRPTVNQQSAMMVAEFDIPLPAHEDHFEALFKFYNAVKANFN